MTLMSNNRPEAENTPSPFVVGRSNWIDVLGGFVLPVVCVLVDPFVFKSSDALPGEGGPLLGRYLVFGYGEILLGMTAFALYQWQQVISPFLSGMLLMGAVFAAGLGLTLLPFSFIGLLFLIGVLGFSPFVSCFVFARAYLRLNRLCLVQQRRAQVMRMTALGVLFAGVLPTGAQMAVNAMVDPALHRILTGDTSVEVRNTLSRLLWVADLDPLVNAYRVERDETRKEALADAYTDITGTSIEERVRRLAD